MAKQWTKDEKINILKATEGISRYKVAKIFNISPSTIERWRSEIKLNGENGLEWGSSRQSIGKNSKNQNLQNLKKAELLEMLSNSPHLDILLRSVSKKKKFKKINELYKKHKFRLTAVCEITKLSRQVYNKWVKQGMNKYNKWDEKLAQLFLKAYTMYLGVYGYQMLTLLINKINKSDLKPWVVYRYTKKLGILANTRKKRYKYNLASEKYKYENILNRDFTASYYGEKIVTDITYLHCNNNTFFLSVVKDLWSGSIIDHQISDNLEFDFVLNNIRNAKLKIGTNVATLIHSDQGIHYTNKRYKELCDSFNMTIPMSRHGNSPDNGACESFLFPFKCEAIYYKNRGNWTKTDLTNSVNQYIKFYNSFRPQKRLKNMSPDEYVLSAHI